MLRYEVAGITLEEDQESWTDKTKNDGAVGF